MRLQCTSHDVRRCKLSASTTFNDWFVIRPRRKPEVIINIWSFSSWTKRSAYNLRLVQFFISYSIIQTNKNLLYLCPIQAFHALCILPCLYQAWNCSQNSNTCILNNCSWIMIFEQRIKFYSCRLKTSSTTVSMTLMFYCCIYVWFTPSIINHFVAKSGSSNENLAFYKVIFLFPVHSGLEYRGSCSTIST